MRKRILAPTLFVLLSATLGSAAPITEPPECVVAAAWVRAHAAELPTTLPELSKHSTAYRRAIYAVLPAATRASLWREHLQSFLRSDAPLTAEQRVVVGEVIEVLPALTAPGANRAWTRSVERRVAEKFAGPLRASIFMTLGTLPAAAPKASPGPWCNCEVYGDPAECQTGICVNSLCTYYTGCGRMWGDQCTGLCRFGGER
ncbi:MAG TPA: bacteriocin fulvocin C-related protein [Longimicrobium sp.]